MIILREPSSVHWALITQFCKLYFLAGTGTRLSVFDGLTHKYHCWFSYGLCAWQWGDSPQYSGPSSFYLPTFSLEAGFLHLRSACTFCVPMHRVSCWFDWSVILISLHAFSHCFGLSVLLKVLQIMQVCVNSKLVSSEHIRPISDHGQIRLIFGGILAHGQIRSACEKTKTVVLPCCAFVTKWYL